MKQGGGGPNPEAQIQKRFLFFFAKKNGLLALASNAG
jgi:hypothetical protein